MNRSAKDFVAIVELAEGNHEYKFLVDGQWVNDNNSPVVETDQGEFCHDRFYVLLFMSQKNLGFGTPPLHKTHSGKIKQSEDMPLLVCNTLITQSPFVSTATHQFEPLWLFQ